MGGVGAGPGGGGGIAGGRPGCCHDALDGAGDGDGLCARERGGGERCCAPPVDAHGWFGPMGSGLGWGLECVVRGSRAPDGWVDAR